MMKWMSVCLIAAAVLVLARAAFADASVLAGLEFKHGIAFFNELKYPADFEHLEYLNPDAPKGGAMVISSQSNFNTLTPSAEGATLAPGLNWLTIETLLLRAGDEVSSFYGRLADGIAVTPDQLAIVFRIHPQARWNDGVPLTAKDAVFSIQTALAELQGAIWYGFIDSVQLIDERHLAVHLKEPMTLNNIIMFTYLPIYPEHYWTVHDPDAVSMDVPVGSGPYRISAIEQNKFVEYERIPDYWGRDIPVNRGLYNFDRIRFDVYRDATVVREALKKGLIDHWTEQDVRYWHDAYDIPALEKGWLRKIRRNFHIEIGVRRAVALNNRLPRFQDRRVRKALTLAMDFEWQNRAIHFGYQTRAHSYWPDTQLAATGLPSEDELKLLEPFRDQLPPELFTEAFRFREINSPQDFRNNLIEARQLLLEAGWEVIDGVLREQASGGAFEIEFLSTNPEDSRILLPYFQALEVLGIRGSIRLAETSQYTNRLRNFDFDALLRNHDILLPPVIELKSFFDSSTALEPLTNNMAGISHPALDHLVVQANLATTLAEMVAACRAIDRVVLWGYYQIPLYAVDQPRTVIWDKFGQPDFEPRYLPAFPAGWWYDPVKAARIEISR